MDTPAQAIVRHSGAPSDDALVKEFLIHLAPVRIFSGVTVWTEQDIELGALRQGEVERAMRTARVAILLLTPEFLASEHVERVEIPLLRARHASRELVVIPCLVRSCLWDLHPWLSTLQSLPRDKQSLDSLPDHRRTQVMTEVIRDILRIAKPSDKTAGPFRRGRETRDDLPTALSSSNAALSCFAAIVLHAIDAFKVVATVWIIASVIAAIATELLRRSEVSPDKRSSTDAPSRFSWLMFAVAISGSITAYAAPTSLPPPIHAQNTSANDGAAVSRSKIDVVVTRLDNPEREPPANLSQSSQFSPRKELRPAIPERLDIAYITAMIKARYPGIRSCARNDAVVGRLIVNWTVDPSGAVHDTSVMSDDIQNDRFRECVGFVIKGILFPQTQYRSKITYPLDVKFCPVNDDSVCRRLQPSVQLTMDEDSATTGQSGTGADVPGAATTSCRPSHSTCEKMEDCCSGSTCVSGFCACGSGLYRDPCRIDAECCGGSTCVNGNCDEIAEWDEPSSKGR